MIQCKNFYNLNNRFQIFSETWSKDAFELIDYENPDLIISTAETNQPGFVIRRGNTIHITSELITDELSKQLFEIKCDEEKYKIIPNKFTIDTNEQNDSLFKSDNSSWFIFKSSKTIEKPKNYKIHEGDILKIGRITARIREIKLKNKENYKTDNTFNTNLNLRESNILKNGNIEIKKKIKVEKKKRKKTCRICYIDDDTNENPLIQPCTCSGTMRYIHLDCLKQWIATKSLVKIESNDNCTIYKVKYVECELCKSKLPDYVKHNSKLYCVLEFNSDYDSYICIESLNVDKRKNRYLYIGNLENKKELKVGRGHDCDLLLSDVSVSRFHFKIMQHFDNLFIEDHDSKFGTLILIQTPELILNYTLPLYIQVGRTFLLIKIKKHFSLFSCCNISEKINEYYYHLQNEKHIHYHKNIIVKEEDEKDDDDDNEIEINNQNVHHLKVIEVDTLNNDKGEEYQNHINRLTSIGDNIETIEVSRNQNKNPIRTIGTIIKEEIE